MSDKKNKIKTWVWLGSTAKPSKSNLENAEIVSLHHLTLLSMLPLDFWSTLFYISTTLKANYILLDCNLLLSLNTLWKCHYIFNKAAVSSFEYNYKAAIWDNEYFSSFTSIISVEAKPEDKDNRCVGGIKLTSNACDDWEAVAGSTSLVHCILGISEIAGSNSYVCNWIQSSVNGIRTFSSWK